MLCGFAKWTSYRGDLSYPKMPCLLAYRSLQNSASFHVEFNDLKRSDFDGGRTILNKGRNDFLTKWIITSLAENTVKRTESKKTSGVKSRAEVLSLFTIK